MLVEGYLIKEVLSIRRIGNGQMLHEWCIQLRLLSLHRCIHGMVEPIDCAPSSQCLVLVPPLPFITSLGNVLLQSKFHS
jgi:hypothetical protein